MRPLLAERGCTIAPGIRLKGTVIARYNGSDHELRAGDCAQWSAGPHSFRNVSDMAARFVAVLFSSLY
ncbi:cupin domain-containing protein [Streptomyces xanthochromogenes]|uniref:Cupin type-2 domain-containing protein n=1 Tax=Streptomyces xanthochromogenes TaxID=67384 RepID=A0ABQ2ZHT9_9ACTN|nr:cupin domain-containing protein [Streptomyces xanthochromogenes]GGY14174.1 hypothetical protein GCM10010326_01920 [Streptomyces xanthochromogenes]